MKEKKDDAITMPLWDTIILELDEDMVGKIIHPDNADPRKIEIKKLKVIALGPDCHNMRIGDRLICHPGAIYPFKYEGKQCWLTSERATRIVIAEKRNMNKSRADRMPA